MSAREAPSCILPLWPEPVALPRDSLPFTQPIGAAVAQVFGHKFEGFPAWWLWRTYYLAQMPLWEKRLRVMFSWTIDLFFPPPLVQLKVGQPAPMAERGGGMRDEGRGMGGTER